MTPNQIRTPEEIATDVAITNEVKIPRSIRISNIAAAIAAERRDADERRRAHVDAVLGAMREADEKYMMVDDRPHKLEYREAIFAAVFRASEDWERDNAK